MDGEAGADFAGIQVHQLTQREAVPMRHLGDEHLPGDGGDGAFHHPPGGVDVVHDVQGRGFVTQQLEHFHELHHVLGVVEVAYAHVLDFHHHGVQLLQLVAFKDDVVGARRELRLARIEHRDQVAPFAEDVVHPSAFSRIPAVLGAETAHPAFPQGLVQLVL